MRKQRATEQWQQLIKQQAESELSVGVVHHTLTLQPYKYRLKAVS